MYRSNTDFANVAKLQHVIQNLNTANFFTLLMSDLFLIMAGGYEVCSDRKRIAFNAMLIHVADDTRTPKTFVCRDSVLRVAIVFEVLETTIRQILNLYFLHNDYIKLGHMPFI